MAKTTKNDESMFGDNFKYILILTLLAWMTYTLPQVRAAFEGAYDPSYNLAAASTTRLLGGLKAVPKFAPAIQKIADRPKLLASTTIPQEMKEKEHPGMSPQQVVTLLVGLGIIPQDKLDAARKAVAEANQGMTMPPLRQEGFAKPPILDGATSTREKMPPKVRPLLPPPQGQGSGTETMVQ